MSQIETNANEAEIKKNETEPEKPAKTAEQPSRITPEEAADAVSRGVLRLKTPIQDGDKTYTELAYDFTKLNGWEMARALDSGAESKRRGSDVITDTEAICLFAAAAAKCNGLDARDVKERMGIQDAIIAINAASVFFRGSYLGGLLRISKQ